MCGPRTSSGSGFCAKLASNRENIVFSSDTSEEQFREFGKGRGTVDCCYPVKCMNGHYGELVSGLKKKIDVLLSPMIYSLPSFLNGHVVESLACTRVMAGPENIKAGFLKESDVFAENGIKYATPFVACRSRAARGRTARLLEGRFRLGLPETDRAVKAGYRALDSFNRRMRDHEPKDPGAVRQGKSPCILVIGRPYHMDPGIGHEIESDLQASGFPVLWTQYFPIDDDLMDWMFGEDSRGQDQVRVRHCRRLAVFLQQQYE